MANKAFEVQDSKIRIGGVDLEAGAAGGIVIPGVTRATGYRVEEVEDTGDQTYNSFPPDTENEVVVIDAALYSAIVQELDESHFADYTVTTDGEGYIDEIQVNGQGTYSSAESSIAGGSDMYAYIGAGNASDRPLVPEDWTTIPFRPKMRAGEVENIGGGGGADLGDLRIDTWGYPGNNPVRLTHTTPGESILIQSTDGGENNGRSSLRWHVRPEPDGEGSQYSQVDVQNDGVWVKNADWTGDGGTHYWHFDNSGNLTFPDGSIQTTAYTGQASSSSGSLPAFLTEVSGTNHLPTKDTDYGWDTSGVWFTNATISDTSPEGTSYPIRTSAAISSAVKTQVSVNFVVNDLGADFGIAFFDNVNAEWNWGSNNTRLAAQYNGERPEIFDAVASASNSNNVLTAGNTYRAVFTYDPTDGGLEPGEALLTFETYDLSSTLLDSVTLTTTAFTQDYYVGFAADQDNGGTRTYMNDLAIDIDNGATSYFDTLSIEGVNSELIGDGYVASTGYQRTVYSNYQGYQGGESTSVLVNASDLMGATFAVGDTITFRNGEVRTINWYDDTNYGPQVAVGWDTDVAGGDDNPRYPITLTTSNYVAEVKKTARIKPDDTLVSSGQYVNVYAGGPTVIEKKHIHMAGANADTELFLGTDNNFVSSKEAGLSPARVNLKSENDITVTDTNLRMTRGSTWVSVYGDGINRDSHNGWYDLTWNVIDSDDHGNFYVGGESCNYAEAMVGKYGPDGDLIWKKTVNGANVSGWQPDGIAYNPVDKEVAVTVQTDYNGNNNRNNKPYNKVTVFDSETGDFKRVFDVYDLDSNEYNDSVVVNDMTWHPTLGYVLVGYTYGEMASTGNINSVVVDYNLTTVAFSGNEVLVTDNGSLPGVVPQAGDTFDYNGGTQTISSVNTYSTYYGLVVNGLNAGDSGGAAVVLHHDLSSTGVIELDINDVKIGGVFPVGDTTWTISGTNLGDNTQIQGGSIGLYRNCPVINLTNPSATGLEVGIQVIYGSSPYYSNHSTQVAGTGYSFGDNFKILGSYLGGVDGVNDITGTIVDNSNIANGFSGTPAATTWRLDVGWGMGYGSANFKGGTFQIKTPITNRAFVWTSEWNKIYSPTSATQSSTAFCVTANKLDGGVLVGGMDNATSRGFVWNVGPTGTTLWLKGLDNDTGNNVTSIASSSYGYVYYTTNYNSINQLNSNGTLIKRVEPSSGAMGYYDPIIKLRQELDGEEYIYLGAPYNAMWMGGPLNGYVVQKFSTDLTIRWSRDFWNNNRSLDTQYETYHPNVALGRDNMVMVGYTYLGSFNNVNGYLASISISDDFEPFQVDSWTVNQSSYISYPEYTNDYTTYDLLAEDGSTGNGSIQLDTDPQQHDWTNWAWKSSIIKLDNLDKGIVGVESINFADGGKLDHNPGDIPPVFTDFNAGDGWNYTLKLSDRGKFIINENVPNGGYCNNLYITVPSNLDVRFPVGSVITLINSHDANNNGYRIYVQPANYPDNEAPRIWAAGTGNQNYSTWSFQGTQTATLMKIGSNEWLLTANNIQNED